MEEWSNWFQRQWYIGYFGVFQLVLYHKFSPFGTDPRFCGSVSRGFGSWWGTPGTFLLLHTNFNFIYMFHIKNNRECTKLIMIFNVFISSKFNFNFLFYKSKRTCWQYYCFAVCYLNIKYTFSIKRNVKNKAFIFVYEGLHGSRVLGPGNMDVSTDTTASQ